MKFLGIPTGPLKFTSVPNVVFSELLPLMDDAAQLKVTLHIFFLLSQKKGSPRYVTARELSDDSTLMRSLEFSKENLERGLDKATACGALLQAEAGGTTWYFFNTPESVGGLEKIERGELRLAEDVRVVRAAPQETPNIYKLYEQHIGALTPLVAEELKEAEQEYPADVILDAFRSAAENNKRSWRYVNKILLNWTRSDLRSRSVRNEKTRRPSSRERRPSITGKLADVAKSK
jgi:DnaD/phage-associated family protein